MREVRLNGLRACQPNYPAGAAPSPMPQTGKEANAIYSKFVIRELLKRACHPTAYLAPIGGLLINDVPAVERQWDNVAIVRYRSWRDFLDIFTSDAATAALVHKFAGINQTIVIPSTRGTPPVDLVFSPGPRIMVAFVLLLIRALCSCF
jgi:hypothetical protein